MKDVVASFPQETSNTQIHVSVQTEEQVLTFHRIHFQSSLTTELVPVCLLVTPVCRSLPRPPGGAADWTLLFGDAAVDCGAQRREVSLSQLLLRGRLQLVEVLHQSSLLLVLLQQLCHEANGHLQDVCFLQLGVWLLVEELWTQERLGRETHRALCESGKVVTL